MVIKNYKIPSIHDGGSSSFKRYEWVKYSMYDLFWDGYKVFVLGELTDIRKNVTNWVLSQLTKHEHTNM